MKRKLVEKTIWGSEFLAEIPPRFRALYTIFIPLNHFLLAAFGVLEANEIFSGIPVPVVLATSYGYAVGWTTTVCGLALLTLFALIRRFERLEMYATIALIVASATYPAAELVLLYHGNIAHEALTVGLPMFLLIPAWRVIDLIRIIRRRGPRGVNA